MKKHKEIIAVYQDCVLCGDKGRRKMAKIMAKGVLIRKVSFISEEGRELCARAVERGIGTMPFYTDGDKNFSTKLSTFTTPETKEKPEKPKRKSRKNTSKKKEEKLDGNSE